MGLFGRNKNGPSLVQIKKKFKTNAKPGFLEYPLVLVGLLMQW